MKYAICLQVLHPTPDVPFHRATGAGTQLVPFHRIGVMPSVLPNTSASTTVSASKNSPAPRTKPPTRGKSNSGFTFFAMFNRV